MKRHLCHLNLDALVPYRPAVLSRSDSIAPTSHTDDRSTSSSPARHTTRIIILLLGPQHWCSYHVPSFHPPLPLHLPLPFANRHALDILFITTPFPFNSVFWLCTSCQHINSRAGSPCTTTITLPRRLIRVSS